jgi:hypothetical protein
VIWNERRVVHHVASFREENELIDHYMHEGIGNFG